MSMEMLMGFVIGCFVFLIGFKLATRPRAVRQIPFWDESERVVLSCPVTFLPALLKLICIRIWQTELMGEKQLRDYIEMCFDEIDFLKERNFEQGTQQGPTEEIDIVED